MGTSLLARLNARDRALFARWAAAPTAGWRRAWVTMTHLGGLWCTAAAAGVPLFAGGLVHAAAVRAAFGLMISHAIVQVIKRSVFRERPSSAMGTAALVADPDAFSFPSGHATAAMAVAFAYAVVFPNWAAPLMLLAGAVGLSRVCLGVHYPGDVLAGQAIAVLTDVCLVRMI